MFSAKSLCLFVCQQDNFLTIKRRIIASRLAESEPYYIRQVNGVNGGYTVMH